jgi:hypothetical protein
MDIPQMLTSSILPICWNLSTSLVKRNYSSMRCEYRSDSSAKALEYRQRSNIVNFTRLRLRTCATSEFRTILNRIKQMKTNLHGEWSHFCSDALSTHTSNQAEQPKFRKDIHSRLECYLLHMFIGRPFILASHQLRTGSHSKDISAAPKPPEQSQMNPTSPHEQWESLVQDCITAAKSVISICHTMRIGCMGLAKSSYIEYSSCRASLLVLVAYSMRYRTNKFSNTLQKGLDAIREMASVSDSARSEVCLLETLEAALQRLLDFDSAPNLSSTIGGSSAQEGYEGLLNWYTRLGGSKIPRPGPLMNNSEHAQRAKALDGESSAPTRLNSSDPVATDTSDAACTTECPFDLNFSNPDVDMAFFTQDFGAYGNSERELFESLLWMPK